MGWGEAAVPDPKIRDELADLEMFFLAMQASV